MAKIKRVIYSKPVTCIVWEDGTMTKARCDNIDTYDELSGFMLCVFKKLMHAKQMRKLFADYVYGDDPKKIKREGASRKFSIDEIPSLDPHCFLIGDGDYTPYNDKEIEKNLIPSSEIIEALTRVINAHEEIDEKEDDDIDEIVITVNADAPNEFTNIIQQFIKDFNL